MPDDDEPPLPLHPAKIIAGKPNTAQTLKHFLNAFILPPFTASSFRFPQDFY